MPTVPVQQPSRSPTVPRPVTAAGRDPGRDGRIAIALGVVALAVGVFVAGGSGTSGSGTSEVSGQLRRYRLVDGETVDVTISVTMRSDPSRPAVCIVRARSKDGSGRTAEVLVGPSDRSTVSGTAQVQEL